MTNPPGGSGMTRGEANVARANQKRRALRNEARRIAYAAKKKSATKPAKKVAAKKVAAKKAPARKKVAAKKAAKKATPGWRNMPSKRDFREAARALFRRDDRNKR